MRKKLTKRVVDAARPLSRALGAKVALDLAIWDTDVKGFGLIVKPGGTKTFVLSYRNRQGRQRRITLGRFGDPLTCDAARERAIVEKARVLGGDDPVQARRDGRQKAAEAVSFADLCGQYLEKQSKVHKKSWREDERRIEKHLKTALGELRAEGVQQQHVRDLYRSIGRTTTYEANRVLALVSAIYTWAWDEGVLDRQDNPARLPKRIRYKEKGRDRPVTSAELPRLLRAISEHSHVHRRDLWLLVLLTGLRKSEWLGATWQNVDLERATLRLPDTKAGVARHVPLSKPALELVRELRRNRMPGNDHLFPSPKLPGEAMRDPKLHWRRVRRVAGCSELRVHDLRHSVATWIAESGEPVQVIQQALGHADIEMTMRYVHQGDQAARKALEAIGTKILEASPTDV